MFVSGHRIVQFQVSLLERAWRFQITGCLWGASRITLPTVTLGIAASMAILGIVLTWRALKPRWIFALRVALVAVLGALRFNLAQPHFDQTMLATRSANDTNLKKNGR